KVLAQTRLEGVVGAAHGGGSVAGAAGRGAGRDGSGDRIHPRYLLFPHSWGEGQHNARAVPSTMGCPAADRPNSSIPNTGKRADRALATVCWRARSASNRGPDDYESPALTRLSYGPAQDGPDLSRLHPAAIWAIRVPAWVPDASMAATADTSITTARPAATSWNPRVEPAACATPR